MARAPSTIPSRFCRRRVCYRQTGPGGAPPPVPACGFMPKPDESGAQYDLRYACYVAVYVLRGRGVYVDENGVETPVGAGALIQRLPGRQHATIPAPDGDWLECFFELDRGAFEALVRFGGVDGRSPVLLPGVDLDVAARFETILTLLLHAPERRLVRALPLAEGILLDLHEAHRENRAGREGDGAFMEEACRALAEDPGGREPLTATAARFHMSYGHFRKLFRRGIGMSPGEYRIRRRIDRARVLLAQERTSVKEAAAALGYPDVYSFSKQFKRVVGQSPSLFLQANGLSAPGRRG